MFKIKQTLLHKGQVKLLILLVSSVLVITGCNSSSDSDSGSDSDSNATTFSYSHSGTAESQARVTQIPQVSDADYDNNVNGLITGNTLKGWIDNWTTNRPTEVTGKLVILQAYEGITANYEYIKPDGTDVFTYHATEWSETRSNGVINTGTMVPSGESMDAFLKKYDIDPVKDMIVCAPSKAGTAGAVMRAGRCWYMFRYWGVAKENLAILNGDNDWIAENTALVSTYFSTTGSTPPNNGTASVKDLSEVNVVLQATVEDMLKVVVADDSNNIEDGVFIWDARSETEYNKATFTYGIQSHPNGALLLEYSNLLNSKTDGYTWKTKAAIQAYLDGETDTASVGFVDGSLQALGASMAYQPDDVVYTYCKSTMRAMITGFASVAILGKPTRFYDGAMQEWNNLTTVVNISGSAPLADDSNWRTDKVSVSSFVQNPDALNTPAPDIIDGSATSANAIVDADLAYKKP